MPLPDFTADERYLISWVKSSAGGRDSFMWTYIATGIMTGAVAAYYDSIPFMVVALAVVCGSRLIEEWYQARWLPVWRSLIGKYETAALGKEPEGNEPIESRAS